MITFRLTDDQAELLQAIGQYQAAHGFCPTIRELQQITGTSSSSLVHLRLDQLRSIGLITWEPFVARTIRLQEAIHGQR